MGGRGAPSGKKTKMSEKEKKIRQKIRRSQKSNLAPENRTQYYAGKTGNERSIGASIRMASKAIDEAISR